MVKISLLHPSRGRPQKAKEAIDNWLIRSSHKFEIEYILSLDTTDPKLNEYLEIWYLETWVYEASVNNNTSVVEATNTAAKESTGDILVYLSDDFMCPDGWDEQIVKEFENENRPLVLRVDDCLQRFDTPILTIPIMNRELYNKLGYFWYAEYKSMFCDEDLFWTAMSIGAVKNCPNLKFPHEHYSNGKAKRDETYIRSESNWNQGKEVFRRRKLEKFKI